MPRYIPISSQQHRDQGWRKYASYDFAAHDALVPLVFEELPHALATLPLAFRQVREDGAFELVAMMSLQPELNLFVHPDGRWLGGYIPAAYRAHPFRLLREQSSEQRILCIDEQSGLLREQLGEHDTAFFDGAGKPSQTLARLLEFLEKIERQRRLTQRAVDALAEHGLIVPWELKVRSNDAEPLPIKGMYHIDEAALKALDAESLHALNQAGALSMAHVQLFSEHRLTVLSRLYRLRDELAGGQADIDIEELFGGDDDISFDFDS